MATEDLVPRGLPQGGRQQVEAGLRAAELPTDSETAGVAPAPVAPPAVGQVPARQQLQSFDVFADRTPNPVAAPPAREVIFEQVRRSDNAVLQDIFGRMSGYKEG